MHKLHLRSRLVTALHSVRKNVVQEERDVLLTADIGGTNCRFSLWAANIRVDVTYDEIFTKVRCQCATILGTSAVSCDL